MTAEEEEDDPQNINIPEAEGQHEVEGLRVENPEIPEPLKTRQVNMGSEVEPKFVKIGEYWDEYIVDKMVKLLPEYQDLFPTNFVDLKGIIRDLGVMKITLKPDAKPVK